MNNERIIARIARSATEEALDNQDMLAATQA